MAKKDGRQLLGHSLRLLIKTSALKEGTAIALYSSVDIIGKERKMYRMS